jgi:hypothetical protein
MIEVELVEVLAFLAGIAMILLVLFIAVYVYLSLTTMRLAKKTGTKYGWLAWIPFANFYLYSKMAGMHWWPIFLLVGIFIPYLGIPSLIAFTIFNFIWFWKIFDNVGRPGLWSLFPLIPIAGWLIFLILLGVAAWSEENKISKTKYALPSAPVIKKTAPRPQPARVSSSRLDRIKKLKGSLK